MTHQARLFAASIKTSIAHAYATGGTEFGIEASRRTLWEIGDMLADVHGPEMAAKALYSVADTVAVGGGVESVWPPKSGAAINLFEAPQPPEPSFVGIDLATKPDVTVISIVEVGRAAPPTSERPGTFLIRDLARLANEALAENWLAIAIFTALWGFLIGRG